MRWSYEVANTTWVIDKNPIQLKGCAVCTPLVKLEKGRLASHTRACSLGEPRMRPWA
jgi:hypothetical protein